MTQDKETKPRKKRVTKKDKAYVDNYRAEAEKLYKLSRFATMQLLGERPAGDPRVEYMAGLEAFKNLANTQISGIIHILNENQVEVAEISRILSLVVHVAAGANLIPPDLAEELKPAILRLMGDREAHFREILQRELSRQVQSLEQDFAVTGWTKEGVPLWRDLQAMQERIKDWPGASEHRPSGEVE